MYLLPNKPFKAEPWNKGKLIGQKPPLKLKEIWGIRIRLCAVTVRYVYSEYCEAWP